MKNIDKFVLLFLAIKFLTACTKIKKGKMPVILVSLYLPSY